MPLYSYRCVCGNEFSIRLPAGENQKATPCPDCKKDAQRKIGSISFFQKGDVWLGKNIKIKDQMALKNRKLNVKSRERRHDAPGMRLAPNVGGERVDTWAEAQKLAQTKNKDANSYDHLVQKEQK